MKPFYANNDRAFLLYSAVRRWYGTPFRANSRVAGGGGGVDCVNLALAIQIEAGACADMELPVVPLSWHEHHEESAILDFFQREEVRSRLRMIDRDDPPMHGDIAAVRVGLTVHHLATVVEVTPGVLQLFHVPRGNVAQLWPLDHPLLRIVGLWRVYE